MARPSAIPCLHSGSESMCWILLLFHLGNCYSFFPFSLQYRKNVLNALPLTEPDIGHITSILPDKKRTLVLSSVCGVWALQSQDLASLPTVSFRGNWKYLRRKHSSLFSYPYIWSLHLIIMIEHTQFRNYFQCILHGQ